MHITSLDNCLKDIAIYILNKSQYLKNKKEILESCKDRSAL